MRECFDIDNSKFIPVPYYVVSNDNDFTILDANSHFFRLLERSKETIATKYSNRLSAIIHPDDYRHVKDALKTSDFANCPVRFRGVNGEVIYTDTFISKIGDNRICCVSSNITHHKDKLKECNALEHKYNFIATKTKSTVFEYNPSQREATYYDLHNRQEKQIIKNFPDSLTKSDIIHPSTAKDFTETVNNMAIGRKSSSCEVKIKLPNDSEYRWYMIAMERIQYDGNTHIIGIMEDINRRKESMLSYLRETRCYQVIMSDTDAWGQIDINDDKIVKLGGLWSAYNNLTDTMTYSELTTNFINKVVHPADRAHYLSVMDRDNLISSYKNNIPKVGCEFRRIVEQNKMVWMRLTLNIFPDPLNDHLAAVLYIKNIDTEKKNELMLQRESRRDSLTGCLNRKMTEIYIKEHIKNNKNSSYAFVVFDLDNFKDVNDSYGHSMGDKVLVTFASVIKNQLKKDDIIGRFGGDEFIAFIKNLDSEESLENTLGNIIKAFTSSMEISVSCSIGAVIGPKYAASYEKLFQYADIALYSAKNSGKSTYVLYNGFSLPAETDVNKADRPVHNNAAIQPLFEKDVEKDAFACDFATLLGEHGDMAYIADMNTFELIKGNKAFYDRLGVSEEDCIGIKCHELLHERNTPCPFCSKLNWSDEKFYIWKNYNQILEQDFLIKNKLINWKGQTVMLAIAVDISNNKNITDFVDYSINAEKILLNTIYKITEATSLEESVSVSLESIAHFYKADRVQLWEKGIPNSEYVLSNEYCLNEETSLPTSYERTLGAFLDENHGNIWVENPDDMLIYSFDMYKQMKSMSVDNYRVTQIINKGEVHGCIVLENIRTYHKYTSFIDSLCYFIVKEIQRYMREGKIEYMRRHDTLTGLLNRISYEEYTGSFNSERISSVGVLAANINELSKINNSSGYEEGNAIIKEISTILKKIFINAKIFRPSGDEFIVSAENISKDTFEENATILKNVLSSSDKYSVAVGYVWDNVDKNLGLLIWHSYELMKINKQLFHDKGLDSAAHPRYEMLNELLSSLEKGHYIVYYQPKKDLTENKIIGAEALIRQIKDDGNIAMPSEFLKKFEENGMIRYIDLFVFEEVCKLIERRQKDGCPPLKISVNFSKMTLFESEILATLTAIIDKYNIDKKYIEIEITETVSGMGKNIFCRIAQDIKNAGLSLSLDDFGMKHSNLSSLADVSFDVIKLDKSLIHSLIDNTSNRIILKNIINMCNELGSKVIAEGVETIEQEKILADLGCRFVQGYLYGKPMPVEEFKQKFC